MTDFAATYRYHVKIHIARGDRNRHLIREGERPILESVKGKGRVPRISRLMALAIHLDGLVRSRQVKNYAAIAERGHVTRARVSQIMNLLFLAPDIVEEILFLPRALKGRDPFGERHLRHIAATHCWKEQRVFWRELKEQGGLS